MSRKYTLVVLSGAGMSAESGISTFRGQGGLWEGHRIEEVASPEAWHRNPEMVLSFYNKRRRNVLDSRPNNGHLLLAEMEKRYSVRIITQNVDDLHERAGSSQVMHLHGEILKSQSTIDPRLVYSVVGTDLNLGDRCELGSQLRPHIVWFGEEVPLIEEAAKWIAEADVFVVIGTSLMVYPAAGLIHAAAPAIPKFIIDPQIPEVFNVPHLESIELGASKGVEFLQNRLRELLL